MKRNSGQPHAIPLFFLLAMGAAIGHAQAQVATRYDDATAHWTALTPERLDTLRGGFSLPSGLNLSFGIERVVFVNGVLVTSTSVSIPDVGQMTAAQARALAAAIAPVLVQNGHLQAGTGNIGITIQNSLDNQTIRSVTTLDVGVDTLGLYKSLNAQSSLQNAIISFSSGP